MGNPKIIVLGIGNILMADDGVGVRAIEKIKSGYKFPANVELYDGGATGMHGLLPLIEDAGHLIVIDAVNGKGEPGEIYRFTVDDFKLTIPKKLSAHDIGFIECLTVTELNGRMPETVTIIGIKPEKVFSSMELSDLIKGKMEELVEAVLNELHSLNSKAVPI